MLKLQEFVSDTITQIINGVKASQEKISDSGGVVNPTSSSLKSDYYEAGGTLTRVENIEFDVAVTVSEESEGKAGAGIFVAGFGLGAQEINSELSSSLSRIKFKVPVVFPKN